MYLYRSFIFIFYSFHLGNFIIKFEFISFLNNILMTSLLLRNYFSIVLRHINFNLVATFLILLTLIIDFKF